MYLDLHKTFDAEPHRRLLEKVAACGIEGKLHRWIESFLSGRTRVDINVVKSEWKSVEGGVSHGSALGPSLFVLFINDVPDGFINSVYIFTDDTKISMLENLKKQTNGQKNGNSLSTQTNAKYYMSEDQIH